jgi:hypothetical protein
VRSNIASNSASLSEAAPLWSIFSRGRSFSGQFLIDIHVSICSLLLAFQAGHPLLTHRLQQRVTKE